MAALVDIQLIEGLGLPYMSGAEGALLDEAMDPLFNEAWQEFVALFPGLTLEPLFNDLPVEQLADLVDGIRVSGEEPPNPFLWYTVACDEAVVNDVVAALQALPLVIFAEQRIKSLVASSISYGTNPEANLTLQIQPAPNGVDAIYAWQIPGGAGDEIRIGDIENGWRLDHDELITARIRRLSVFGASDVDHGTAVAGILVGADNGVGTIGLVPNAALELITPTRAFTAFDNVASAIGVAAATLNAGDVLLLEVALPFGSTDKPDVFVEMSRPVQVAIALATRRGIVVIEPAGNGTVKLDDHAVLAHTRPGSSSFVDSGAIVVGAGNLTNPALGTWSRANFSSFGSRVDCFAAGSGIRAPSSAATNSYQFFGGTSGASAIIAGVAAALQGMTRARDGTALAPSDVRRLLRTALFGTPTDNLLATQIGPMPDLRKLTRAQGFVRVVPVGAVAIGGNALLMVHLDANNRMVRRHFTLLTGWGPPVPSPTLDGLPSASDDFELNAAQPAVTSTDEIDPIARLVFQAFFSGPAGLHRMFWDSGNQSGDVSAVIAPFTSAAQGRAVAAVRPLLTLVVVAAINADGRLVVMTGDPQILSSGMSFPLVLDAVGNYRRVSGPAIVNRGAGLADIVVIEDGGGLNWFTGRLPATIGTGWFGPVTEPSGTSFDPRARPALLVTGDLLLAAAVVVGGSLSVVTINPSARSMDAPVEVDSQEKIATSGPVALGLTLLNVVVLAVDIQGALRASTRPISGGDWTPLEPLFSSIPISPFGGVTAVSIDIGVVAIAVAEDGIVHSAISVDGLIWSQLLPLP